MMDQILISIIIPVYNVTEWIERCLLSVCNQTYDNLECIIVNDATPDDSMAIVEKVLNEYKGDITFKIINHEINKGLSAARNSGVKASKGKYLFFLDSDDELYSSNDMQLFYNYMKKYGDSDFFVADYDGIGFNTHFPIPRFDKAIGQEILYSYVRGEWPSIACAKFIKRSFFINNNMYFKEGLLHEDLLFSFRLAFYSSSMIVIHQKVYKYYAREGSITKTQRYKNYTDCLYIISENYKLISTIDFNRLLKEKFLVSFLYGLSYSFFYNNNLSHIEKKKLCHKVQLLLKDWKISIIFLGWRSWCKLVLMKYMYLHQNIQNRFVCEK
jgi:glycosyltransferase involved in cell wall biosynthesis